MSFLFGGRFFFGFPIGEATIQEAESERQNQRKEFEASSLRGGRYLEDDTSQVS